MTAIGCMRLSTVADIDETSAIAVLHAALDGGVRHLDTADAYAPGPDSIGHNERLIAKALAAWDGDAGRVTVATKGGLTRPRGAWVPDGRAKHLRAACEASARALGVDRISLYQLHVVDPKTPLKTSVRALAKLAREGLIDRIGLCNVGLPQLLEAEQYADIASVQVELGLWRDDAVRGGVVAYCRDRGIELFAHRPFGGTRSVARVEKDAVLREVAAELQASPHEVALAWLRSLAPRLTPLPGPTTPVTARSCARSVALSDESRRRLDERFVFADLMRRDIDARRPAGATDREVVLVMGAPGSGKTTHAREFVERGYERLNRDERGGRLDALVGSLKERLAAGVHSVVMDNTYATRAARNRVVEAAWKGGAQVRCVWVDAATAQAQRQAVLRMLNRFGKLRTPEEMKDHRKDDPNSFPPRVQLDYRRKFEPPQLDEGFAEVTRIARDLPEPAFPDGSGPRALVIDVDRVLGRDGGADADIVAGLTKYVEDGWQLLGYAWRPEVAAGRLTAAQADEQLQARATEIGLPLVTAYCEHGAGAAVCWCRPPLPGLVLLAAHRANVAANRLVLLGESPAAKRFAATLAIPYVAASTL